MSRVLLAEDDKVTGMIFARALKGSGYEVEIAKDGLEAVEMLESGDFDALVTDMMMPRLGGQELCELVRSECSHQDLPILITTGISNPKQLAWVNNYKGIEIFLKPVCLKSLVARLDSLLES